jgi:hypothetical protein
MMTPVATIFGCSLPMSRWPPLSQKRKMHYVIEMWAPWMSAEEREAYVNHVWGLDIYERTLTAVELGQRLGVTNAERESLKLWPFIPIDKTDEELAEQSKARERERRARKRRAKGVRTREAYLAELASRPKPWIAEGISRRTWERRRKVTQGVFGYQKTVTQAESEITVFKQRSHVASPKVGDLRKEGHQGGVFVERQKHVATEAECKERNASSSPELRTDLATSSSLDREVA